jgi:hypothetical protein
VLLLLLLLMMLMLLPPLLLVGIVGVPVCCAPVVAATARLHSPRIFIGHVLLVRRRALPSLFARRKL